MTPALERIAALLHEESGIVTREPQFPALAAALERLEIGADPEAALAVLSDHVRGPRSVARLVDEITVKETFFLRHAEQLGSIDWPSLLRVARANGSPRVRVWSAACATGEEAYSLALLACDAFATPEPPVSILATDISSSALAAAAAGEYRERSARELDADARRRHFVERRGRLVAGAGLRALVTFARHNLAAGPVPPLGHAAFELILCRNVLIYFDPGTVDRVAAALERAVAPGGRLMLGAADALCGGAGRLRAAAFPDAAPAAIARPPGSPVRHRARPVHDRAGARARRAPPPSSRPAPPRPAPAPRQEDGDAVADFMRGLAELEASNPRAAVAPLRRALYLDPTFGLAAFQLGRCYESLGDTAAARRAYRQAVRMLDEGGDDTHEALLEQVSVADLRVAAATRLHALGRE